MCTCIPAQSCVSLCSWEQILYIGLLPSGLWVLSVYTRILLWDLKILSSTEEPHTLLQTPHIPYGYTKMLLDPRLLLSPYTLLVFPLIYYLLPFLRNSSIRSVPGPAFAAFSNLWLLYQCRRGRRFVAVDNAHKKYGKLVRIQPDHVSVADESAIPVIYSHTGGWLKRYAQCPALTSSTISTRENS